VGTNTNQTVPSGGMRVAASYLQHQLRSLLPKKSPSNLESSCIFAALVYIDHILLQTLKTAVTKSKVSRRLHHKITQSRSAWELQENGDVLTWISATASATFGSNGKRKEGLVDKFGVALTGLENLVLYDNMTQMGWCEELARLWNQRGIRRSWQETRLN
jgi:hypothetical protein